MTAYRRRAMPKKPPARETHDSIRVQTRAFLERGGAIQVVPLGDTGEVKIAGPLQLKRGKPRLY